MFGMKNYMQDISINGLRCIRPVKVQITMPYIRYYIYELFREKYIKMYERFVAQLKEYSRAIRILSKGYLPISLLPPSK